MDRIRIEKTWFELLEPFNSDRSIAQSWFDKIVGAYTAELRHYHNLTHVGYLLDLINAHSGSLSSPSSLKFAAFFHDYVYEPGSSSNEKSSADIANEAMLQLGVPSETREQVFKMILATQQHHFERDEASSDLAFFLDMDMAILGETEAAYDIYKIGVAKEFESCSSVTYKLGRTKFILDTLRKPSIFNTVRFREVYELKARENLLHELSDLVLGNRVNANLSKQ